MIILKCFKITRKHTSHHIGIVELSFLLSRSSVSDVTGAVLMIVSA